VGSITLQHIKKTFGQQDVLPDVNLEIHEGEFVVFVGPSGCGKSTLLRLIAGLEEPTSGRIFIQDQDVTDVASARRRLSMVFQSYALYPHMTVYQNIAFPLKMAGEKRDVIDRHVREAARSLDLTQYLNQRPRNLSGGQRQRVAIGRAIVRQPAAFLFDEPLSNLDAALRSGMRVEISRLHQKLGTTMIYVTHDQIEAMTMANRIAVMRAGRIEQFGSPLDLYKKPANRFVAGFIGSPKMNFIEGEAAAAFGAHSIGIRPEHFTLSSQEGQWQGVVLLVERLGADTFAHIDLGDLGTVIARTSGDYPLEIGNNIALTAQQNWVYRFDSQDNLIAPPA